MTPHPHDRLLQNPDDARNYSEHRFEESVVGKLLTQFKLTSYRFALLDAQRELTGDRRLTLDQFWHRFHPPVYLTAAKIGFVVDNNPQAQMFTKFAKCTYVRRYLELHDNYQALDVPLGMIFSWAGVPSGMILHNCDRDLDVDGVFTCWRSGDNWLVLEPLVTFLKNLHASWQPDPETLG